MADNFNNGRNTEINLSDEDDDKLLENSKQENRRRNTLTGSTKSAIVFSDGAIQQERARLEEQMNLKEN